ncbi:MAG TPA: hypothetical protein VE615_09465 [Gaiellaceae bacterium]|jgi:ATP-dependent Zn protease|nr:hypothetical protein [Gaiellaceae bacterium]
MHRAEPGFVQTLFRSALFPLIVIVLLVYLASQTLFAGHSTKAVAYPDLQRIIQTRPETVDELTFKPSERRVVVKLANGSMLTARYPNSAARAELEREVSALPTTEAPKSDGSSAWWNILTALLPFVVFAVVWIYAVNRAKRRRSEQTLIPAAKDFRSDTANQ